MSLLDVAPVAHLTWFGWVLVVAIGLAWGSFLNVLIYRLPLMNQRRDIEDTNSTLQTQLEVPPQINLFWPRSFCPSCRHSIPFYQNVPIVTYLILRARCTYCGGKIPVRYAVVEITTAALVLACVSQQTSWLFAFIDIMVLSTLWTLFWTDFERGLLPDNLTIPLAFVGLGVIGIYAEYAPTLNVVDSVLGLAVGFFSLMSINMIYRYLRAQDGIGRGDFKLFGALGCWFGWLMLPVMLFCAALLALAFSLVTMKSRGLAYSRAVPLGAFLALVGMFVVLAKQFDLDIYSFSGFF